MGVAGIGVGQASRWRNAKRQFGEALHNAVRHSRVRVSLVQHGNDLRAEIQDWGVGFDPATIAADRMGLEGMRERAGLLSGRVLIESAVGNGCHVTVDIPGVVLRGE
jgi:signal transduction histidine kinase